MNTSIKICLTGFDKHLFDRLLTGEVFQLTAKEHIYRQLFQSGEANFRLLHDTARYCFQTIRSSMHDDIISSIGRLFDSKPGMDSFSTLMKSFDQKRFSKEQQSRHAEVWEAYTRCRTEIAPLIMYRHETIAHRKSTLDGKYLLSAQIVEAVPKILDLCNIISRNSYDGDIAFDTVSIQLSADDGDALLTALRDKSPKKISG